MSKYQLRNDILNALNSVYAPEYGGDWYMCKYNVDKSWPLSMNMQLVTDILALFAYAHIDPDHNRKAKYYGETMFNQIRNMIWNCHPGGGTAEIAARKVCKVLHVPIDEDAAV